MSCTEVTVTALFGGAGSRTGDRVLAGDAQTVPARRGGGTIVDGGVPDWVWYLLIAAVVLIVVVVLLRVFGSFSNEAAPQQMPMPERAPQPDPARDRQPYPQQHPSGPGHLRAQYPPHCPPGHYPQPYAQQQQIPYPQQMSYPRQAAYPYAQYQRSHRP